MVGKLASTCIAATRQGQGTPQDRHRHLLDLRQMEEAGRIVVRFRIGRITPSLRMTDLQHIPEDELMALAQQWRREALRAGRGMRAGRRTSTNPNCGDGAARWSVVTDSALDTRSLAARVASGLGGVCGDVCRRPVHCSGSFPIMGMRAGRIICMVAGIAAS